MALTRDEVGETIAACSSTRTCGVRDVLEARASFAEQPSSPFCLPLSSLCLDASSTAPPRLKPSGLTLCSKSMPPHTPAALGRHTRSTCESLLSHRCAALRRTHSRSLSCEHLYGRSRPVLQLLRRVQLPRSALPAR
ncbi:hypothetical protein OH76DRAFT_1184199 [Lentinus brumalis]|uniref:Uncharacterized protein n=1 Tax=Lentinus brumalis TaxID=2498619 RepID=A0A371CTZ6_9APHY|nr:hypothetical protein OH76DRAFT_1184199 [Polyporus brumalis]